MRRRRRYSGSRWSDADKVRYIRMMAIPLVIVVVLIIIILIMDKTPKEKTDPGATTDSGVEILVDQSGTTGESVAPDNSQYTHDFSDYELAKDEVPEVNLLLSQYFQAKVDQDPEALYRVFGKSDAGDMEARKQELSYEAKYIEDYRDITCYTKQGLNEDSYVVYVTYEIKFRRVDTPAPGLMWCYVVKNADGSYIIRENVVGEEADYVAKANQTEDVRLLSSQVNERLREALETDTLLAGAYKELRNGAIVQASEEESHDSNVSLLDGEDGTEGAQESGGSQETGAAQETESSAGDSSSPQDSTAATEETSSVSEVKLGE